MSMLSVYMFATDVVAFSITIVLIMQYCMVYFTKYSNYTNDRWNEQFW